MSWCPLLLPLSRQSLLEQDHEYDHSSPWGFLRRFISGFLHVLAARDGFFLGGANSDGILLCKNALGSYSLLSKQAKPQRVFICNILRWDLTNFMRKTETEKEESGSDISKE